METHANNKLPFPNIALPQAQPLRQPDTPNHSRGPLARSKECSSAQVLQAFSCTLRAALHRPQTSVGTLTLVMHAAPH